MRLLAVAALLACRPGPAGPPAYPDPSAFSDPDDPFLPGPNPYEEGDRRLSVGIWYEGGRSDDMPLGPGADYYIYDGTYTETGDDERVEGHASARLELTGEAGFFGGGVSWVPGRDLSAWSTLFLSVQAEDAVFEDLEVRMIGGGNSGVVRAKSLGFAPDGGWHGLVLPLERFVAQGVDLTDVTEPIQLIGPATAARAALRVDDLYFTDDPWTPPTDTGDPASTGFLPGPDPYVSGEERLAIGLFYEGGASERVDIDDSTAFYYVYDGTYDQSASDDRIQGLESAALTLTGPPTLYWGGGVTWAPARDLSAWTRLTISFKATDTVFSALEVRMTGGGVQGSVLASDRGFAPDGAWHTVTIPLADFAAQGVVLSAVTEPLQLVSEITTGGAVLRVDNLYFDKE